MAINFRFASFPNSRIKPANTVQSATTTGVSCPAGVTTLVAAANNNRRSLTLENTDAATTVEYGYVTPIVAGQGFDMPPKTTADILTTGNVYVYNPGGAPVVIDVDEGIG